MMKYFSYVVLALIISGYCVAGLPPTTSKVSSDSVNVTTFNYQFPNFTGTHTGTTLALGVNSVAGGGTGLATLTANNVILGNGASAPTFVAPSTSGNVLTSNGTTWTSAAPTGGSGIGSWTTETGITASAGFGTVTGSSWKCRQEGENLHCNGFFTTGTVAASALTLTLPTTGAFTCTIDYSNMPTATGGRKVGLYKTLYSGGYILNSDGGGSVGDIYADGSTTTSISLAYQISSGAFSNAFGNGILVASEKVNMEFDVPCTQF